MRQRLGIGLLVRKPQLVNGELVAMPSSFVEETRKDESGTVLSWYDFNTEPFSNVKVLRSEDESSIALTFVAN